MWYSQGTINATNNSSVVAGTQSIADVRFCMGFRGSQPLHEVVGFRGMETLRSTLSVRSRPYTN